MKIKFIGLKNDEQACFSLNILRENFGQNVSLVEIENYDIKVTPENDETLVGIFTTPNSKLLRRGHLSRVASHRITESAPAWTDQCQFLIAIRQTFGKKSRPKDMCKEWIKIVKNLAITDLSKLTPWGSLPTAPTNFELYRKWIQHRLNQDTQKLGIQFIQARNNLSLEEIKIIRRDLQKKKDKRLTDRIIKRARNTVYKVSIPTIIQTGTKLIDLAKEKKLLIGSGIEFELILESLWRARPLIGIGGNPEITLFEREPLLIITPLCPAWTRNESGYNFSGIEAGSKSIFYEKMLPELEYFILFLKTLGLDYKLVAWVADIEWFNLEENSPTRKRHTKDDFMTIIKQQCQLIQTDLESKGIHAGTKPFLEIMPEGNYLSEANSHKLNYEQLLATSAEIQKFFRNTLKAKSDFYQKQFGIQVLPINPHPRIKNALIGDMVSHSAPLAMLSKYYLNSNYMFFLKNEPFNWLYKDVPHIAWR